MKASINRAMGTTARIATICQNGEISRTVEENRSLIIRRLQHALAVSPDLVVLPETFTTVGAGDDSVKHAESVPGPTTDACSVLAKAHAAFVICPILTQRSGTVLNSAVIIGRDGSIVGIYDKAQPVTSSEDYTEMERGVCPGATPPPVFDLDIGRIGIQICYDVGFPESWQSLSDQGAELVLWPSAYNGGFPLEAFAYLHHFYVVTSVRTDSSRIIDPMGVVLEKTDSRLNVIYRDIGLDYVVSHWDFNYSIPESIVAAYGDRISIRSDRDSAHFIVESRDNSVKVADLMNEFGFESTRLYHERHRNAYGDLRDGRAPPPQRAAHADRSQFSK